jgi:hypothetical protein
LALCRDYYNSVKPSFSSDHKQHLLDTNFDKEAHQKKIRDWFMNPIKFSKHLENEQLCHPSKCIYHLSKTHQTDKCAVKLECDRLLVAKRNESSFNTTSPSVGQLRHVTEDSSSVSVIEDIPDVDFDFPGNDTNEDDALLYFERLSKHYLCLVKSSSSVPPVSRHVMNFPVITDSGANCHMFKDRDFFVSLHPASGKVIVGDGSTTLSIKGIGTVQCKVGSHVLTIPNVRYIPDLSESIYSLFQHIKTPDHGLDSIYDDGLYLRFPTFKTKAMIGSDDIYLDMIPLSTSSYDSSNTDKTLHHDLPNFCRTITHTDSKVIDEIPQGNILKDLRHYYNTVTTKRQLGLDVPAGFRSHSMHR